MVKTERDDCVKNPWSMVILQLILAFCNIPWPRVSALEKSSSQLSQAAQVAQGLCFGEVLQPAEPGSPGGALLMNEPDSCASGQLVSQSFLL